jgi:adenosylcobinamide-GDP ribazoletransferase
MTNRDTGAISARTAMADLVSAFGLLTRLPLPKGHALRGANSAWAWPLVGAVVGLVAASAGTVALALGLPAGVAAAAALAAAALVTGGLHEDGLADSADGLFGGWTRERRLEIMKDSAIGSYGVLALVILTLARWSALAALFGAGAHWWALIAAGALSRAPMAVILHLLPNARGQGLSQSVGQPPAQVALGAAALAAALTLLASGGAAAGMIALAALAALAVALTARARIGGQTGDILGAAQVLAEVAALAAAAGWAT